MMDFTLGIWDSGTYKHHFSDGYWRAITNMDDLKIVNDYIVKHPEALIPEPMPPEPTQEEKDAQEIREINARFDAITLASVRPLRAMSLGVDTADDAKRLIELDTEAITLRKRLAELEK